MDVKEAYTNCEEYLQKEHPSLEDDLLYEESLLCLMENGGDVQSLTERWMHMYDKRQ